MKQQIQAALTHVVLPKHAKNVIEEQLVADIHIHQSEVTIVILLDKNENSFKSAIAGTVRDAIARFVDKKLDVKVTYQEKQSADYQGYGIGKVKNIIAVASGKGGVGKSTITANLAIALMQTGASVGLIDADIFGPSVPKMFGVEGATPFGNKVGEKDTIIPVEKWGIKMLSIGFFVQADDAVVWRGPMAGNALKQLIHDTEWGELDYLLIDLPPGTSDIHLTIVQTLPLTGAVIVTTPQDIALIDAIKGIDFFRKDSINVPILGLVENMAWFTPAELPNNKYYIFGKGGGEALCKKMDMPFLGAVPIIQSLREGGDQGEPAALSNRNDLGIIFAQIARIVEEQLIIRKNQLPPSQQVQMKY